MAATGIKENILTITSRNENERNWWFHDCERQGIPYIYITQSTKYSVIHWDLIAYRPRDESVTSPDYDEEFTDKIWMIVSKYTNFKGMMCLGPCVGWIRKIPRELAQECAVKIRDEIITYYAGAKKR